MRVRSIWVGLGMMGVVLYLGVFGGFSDLSIFFNVHALALVFGGTVAIALLSYSFGMLSSVVDFLIFGFIFKKSYYESKVLYDLLVSVYKCKSPLFDPTKKRYEHYFIRDGIDLLRNEKISADEAYEAMNLRLEKFKVRYQTHAKILLNISKYPPALGLLGASTGMIQMMMNLGVGGPEAIGKAMAVALTATFWGIGVANFVFLPLADYAFQLAEDDHQLREVIVEIIVKAKDGTSFDSLVEMVAYSLNIEDQFAFRKSMDLFFQAERESGNPVGGDVIPLNAQVASELTSEVPATEKTNAS